MKIVVCYLWIAFILSSERTVVARKPHRGRGRGGQYRPPPSDYKRKTIDQIIVDAMGGTDAVNSMAPKMTKDGMITAELDMNLTPEQYSHLYGTRGKRKATSNVNRRWTGKVIPYEIVHSHFSYEEVQEIKAALAEWEKFTCLKFQQSTGAEKNKIRIQNGRGCNSGIGMTGGTQVVNLQSPGCRFKGLYLHEVGHAIGLLHEHQLPDRDKFISIKLSNVSPGMRQWFDKYSPDAVNLQGVDYDFASVMHYGKTAFSYNGKAQTIFAKDRSKESEMGQVASKPLSFSDVKAVNMMYKCGEACGRVPSCKNPCFVDKNCKCFCKDDMPKQPCENKDDDSRCQEWATRGECSANSVYMEDNCRKACKLCTDKQGGGGGGGGGGGEDGGRTEEPCKNDFGDRKCNDWAARGECQKNRDWMETNCRKACAKCGPTPTRPQTTTPKPTTRKPTTAVPDDACTNKYGDSQCKAWAERRECQKNPSFMVPNCRKACGRCDTASSGQGSGGNQGADCQDKSGKCASWTMYCASNSYVKENCPKACGTCNQASAPPRNTKPKGRKPKGKKPKKQRGRSRQPGRRRKGR